MQALRGSAHCSVMAFLFLCQGLAQGTLGVLPLILLQRSPQMSSAELATLGITNYAFSFKFIWAPIVDRFYYGDEVPYSRDGKTTRRLWWFHRRLQWVLGLQMMMGIGYFIFSASGMDALLGSVSHSSAAFAKVLSVMAMLSIVSATQDVALDAWAVEGLPPERVTGAGVAQLIGLSAGSWFCNIYIHLNQYYPRLCTLDFLCNICGVTCLLASVAAVWLAVRSYPPIKVTPQRTSPTTINAPHMSTTVLEVWGTRGFKQVLSILVTRGWPVAVVGLAMSRMISMGSLQATDIALNRLLAAAVQMVMASFVAAKVLKRLHAATALRWVTGMEFVLSVLFVAAFIYDTALSAGTGSYARYLVLFYCMVTAVIGSLSFVANVELSTAVAAYHPRDAGSVITILNALGSLGSSLPSSFCLYLDELIVQMFAWRGVQAGYVVLAVQQTSAPTATVEASAKGWQAFALGRSFSSTVDICICAALFFTVAGILRAWYLTPSARALVTMGNAFLK